MPNRRKGKNILAYLVAFIVIVIILVLVFGKGREKPAPTAAPVVDLQVEKLQTQSPSDDVAAIEKDLTNTNLDQIDTELKEVEKNSQSL